MDTAKGYRLSSQVTSSKDDNAPCGAKPKSCAAVLFWHQKSTQKSAAVSHAADPRASQGAPAGAAVFPWRLRHSVLANAKSNAFALTASRAQPIARRPSWAGEGAEGDITERLDRLPLAASFLTGLRAAFFRRRFFIPRGCIKIKTERMLMHPHCSGLFGRGRKKWIICSKKRAPGSKAPAFFVSI